MHQCTGRTPAPAANLHASLLPRVQNTKRHLAETQSLGIVLAHVGEHVVDKKDGGGVHLYAAFPDSFFMARLVFTHDIRSEKVLGLGLLSGELLDWLMRGGGGGLLSGEACPG